VRPRSTLEWLLFGPGDFTRYLVAMLKLGDETATLSQSRNWRFNKNKLNGGEWHTDHV